MVAFVENIWNFLLEQSLYSKTAFFLYWVPTIVCLVGYFFDTLSDYRTDFKNHTSKYYSPKLKVGTIIGRVIVSFVPVCNLFMAVVRHLGMIVSRIYDRFEKFFNFPLVPARPEPEVKTEVVPPSKANWDRRP